MSQPLIQTSFSAGELSPSLFARVDLAKYRVGAATMRNAFVDYRGGASGRQGTRFVARSAGTVSNVVPPAASLVTINPAGMPTTGSVSLSTSLDQNGHLILTSGGATGFGGQASAFAQDGTIVWTMNKTDLAALITGFTGLVPPSPHFIYAQAILDGQYTLAALVDYGTDLPGYGSQCWLCVMSAPAAGTPAILGLVRVGLFGGGGGPVGPQGPFMLCGNQTIDDPILTFDSLIRLLQPPNSCIDYFPSIATILAGTYNAAPKPYQAPLLWSFPISSLNLSNNFSSGSNATDFDGFSKGQQAFLLPGAGGATVLWLNYDRGVMAYNAALPPADNAANVYVQSIAGANPNGAFVKLDLGVLTYAGLQGAADVTGLIPLTALPVVSNASFVDLDGAAAAPFTDEYTYLSSGAAGGTDCYQAWPALVQPVGNGTFIVAFVMKGLSDSATNFVGASMLARTRLFIYSPAGATFVEQAVATQQIYTAIQGIDGRSRDITAVLFAKNGSFGLAGYVSYSGLTTDVAYFYYPFAGLQVRSGGGKARLIRFQFNVAQTYMLEFGEQYMRVIKDGGLVLEPAFAITAASNSDPASITAIGNNFVNGDWVFLSGIVGATGFNNRTCLVASAPGDSFTLTDLDGTPIDSTLYGAYVSGGAVARVFTLATPYAAADLALLKFTQSADVMTLTHPLYAPRRLSRTQHWIWTLTPISFAAAVQPPADIGTLAQNPVAGNPGVFYRYVATSLIDATGEESVSSTPSGIFGNTALDPTKGCQNLLGLTPPAGQRPDRYNIYKALVVGAVDSGAHAGEASTAETIFGFIGSTLSTQFADTNIAPDFSLQAPLHRDPFADGAILDVDVLTGGAGYFDGRFGASPDAITVTDPTGSGWKGYLNIQAGRVISVTTVDAGIHYTAPVFHVTTSTGAGATFGATIGKQSGNWPGCCCFYQARELFAATLNQPATIWGTQTGAFNDMDVSNPVRDSDALEATLLSDEVNAIQHLVPVSSGILAMTENGGWLISGGQSGGALTPSSITAIPQAANGCSATIAPIRAVQDVLYVEFQGSIVRDLSYNFYFNVFTGADLTILSTHLFFGYELVQWTYAEQPFKIVWAVRDDGKLLSLTYLKEQEVTGWSHHDTAGLFKDVESIPGATERDVYFLVERTIPGVNGGDPVLYIEQLASRNFLTAGAADPTLPWCVDCGKRYEGLPAIVISGLDHLEGATLVGLADGNVVRDLTVVGGTVILPDAASRVTLGLSFRGELEPLRLDTGVPTIQDKLKLINRATIRLENTRGLQIGRDRDSLYPIPERTDAMPFDTPIPLVTGDETMELQSDWDRSGQIFIRQDDPLPWSVLGIILWAEIGDTP